MTADSAIHGPSQPAGGRPSWRAIVSVASAISRRSPSSATSLCRSELVRPWAAISSPRARNAATSAGAWS